MIFYRNPWKQISCHSECEDAQKETYCGLYLLAEKIVRMKNVDWNNLRTRLHHDWLQNKYLTFLKAWKGCFDESKACEQDIEEILAQLLQWKKKSEGFQTLINECETALSPRQLLYEPPLNKMSEENKKWFGAVIHVLYCERTRITDKVARLRAMLHEIDVRVDTVVRRLQGENVIQGFAGETLVLAFTNFSKEISALPDEIQVV